MTAAAATNTAAATTNAATATVQTANAAAVLSKAVARAAERLNVSRALLAKVLGVSPSTITRLYAGDYQLEQHRKEWEFALLFVRLFRSLDAIVGGDDAVAASWIANPNTALNARPIEKLQTVSGLVDVIAYLDARRALV